MEQNVLKTKWWYRFLQVIYFLFYIIIGFIILTYGWESKPYQWYSTWGKQYVTTGSWDSVFGIWIFGLLILYIIFELIKRSFLYIVTGKRFIKFSFKQVDWIIFLKFITVLGIIALMIYIMYLLDFDTKYKYLIIIPGVIMIRSIWNSLSNKKIN